MKKTILFLCVLIGIMFAQNNTGMETGVFQPHEYLQYKVKYMFLRVGTLRILNFGNVEKYGHQGHYLKIFIDSNPSVPFVTVHDTYETIVDDEARPIYFLALENQGDYILKTIYDFDYENNSIHILESHLKEDGSETLTADSVTSTDGKIYRESVSLLFFARGHCHERHSNWVSYIIALTKKEKTFFETVGEVKKTKWKNEKLTTWYLKGKLKFIGIVGIKDGFEGWFIQDTQRIPIKAKMKAFFGSIKIELEKFNNWNTDIGLKMTQKYPELIFKDTLSVEKTSVPDSQ